MEEYISRIRKLGANDYVNGDTFNSVIDQLQHNIDLLYRSQASSVYNWNISELLYGNLMDYDQVGQKRYVNGGKLDSVEKILPFSSTVGQVTFEETDILNNSEWLRWTFPGGVKENARLIRDIVVPEALRHQNIIIGVKLAPFTGNDVVLNERYEIYVNGVYAGTGETGTVTLDNIEEPKTIYGVYHLTGQETNLEISLVRSITNEETPAENYSVRISNMFVGLHTLGNSSFSMNYPASGSYFTGSAADVNSFYDFENNAIRPIPAFLINNEQLDGGSSQTINITAQDSSFQHEFWIGISGSGNELGTNAENVMTAQDFFLTEAFSSNTITVHIQNSVESYDDMVFDKGNYTVFVDDAFTEVDIDKIKVGENSSVDLIIENNSASTKLNIPNVEVDDKGRFVLSSKGSNTKLKFVNDGISVGQNSFVDLNVGTFAQKITNAGNNHVYEGGKLNITLNEPSFRDFHGEYGFGMSMGAVFLDRYAFLNIKNENKDITNMNLHFGRGQIDQPITINNHSHLSIEGFQKLSTSANDKKFVGKLHSSIEIFDDIQADGGSTAFTDIKLELFSSFGSPLSGGTLNEDLLESFVYEIE